MGVLLLFLLLGGGGCYPVDGYEVNGDCPVVELRGYPVQVPVGVRG